MNKDVKFLTVILLFSSALLMTSAYLVEFQKWLSYQSNTHRNTLSNPTAGVTGIRLIINSQQSHEKTILPLETNLAKVPDVYNQMQPNDLLPSPAVKIPLQNETLLKDSNEGLKSYRQASSDDSLNQLKDSVIFAEIDEQLLIEFSESLSKEEKKRIISRLLTLSSIPDIEYLVANNAVNTRKKPYYYKQVFNQFKTAIRYPAQAYRYADYLLANHSERFIEDDKEFELVKIPLIKPKIPEQIEPYHDWVKQYAQQYRVEPELVYGIMKTESAFNPKAVSQSNALGLMQIKQKAAGKDVYQHIDNKAGYPSKTTLFNPQENIRIGIAYMGLLKDKYLQQIRNPESKELLMIASYNGGLSKAFEVFGDTPALAVQRINQLYPKNIYRKLVSQHQSAETRGYIDKVLKNKREFAKLLEVTV